MENLEIITIVIVEDHSDYMNLLIDLIESSKELRLIGSFSNGFSAIDGITLLHPNIVICDIGLPDISGIDVLRSIKNDFDNIEFLMLSVFMDDDNIFNSIENGANSFLLKNSDPEIILQSIKDLNNGLSPMSPFIAKRILNKYKLQIKNESKPFIISNREWQIIKLLEEGLLYKEIAEKLYISHNTVRATCYNIYKKLHVNNKLEAIHKLKNNNFF